MASEAQTNYIDRKKQQGDMKLRMGTYEKKVRGLNNPAAKQRRVHGAARKE